MLNDSLTVSGKLRKSCGNTEQADDEGVRRVTKDKVATTAIVSAQASKSDIWIRQQYPRKLGGSVEQCSRL